ncbi:MAG: hypothetical protein WKF79_09735 [Nocardioides sp.]
MTAPRPAPRRLRWGYAVALAPLALGACSGGGDPDPVSSVNAAPDLPRGDDPVQLDPAEFTSTSDNPYFPIQPGQQWTYRELDESGAEVKVVVTVSSETREIANGVVASVVRDTVTADGELVEDTIDWYAQDDAGNVWYLGEDTAEFENGELTTRDGSFEAGVDGALPGIIMPGEPAVGAAYRQEFYEGEAEDNGEVLGQGQQADVPIGHYDDVLLTADTITLEPEVLEFKLYAPDVGLVVALGISGGGGREELVSTTTVSDAAALAAGTAPLGTPYE